MDAEDLIAVLVDDIIAKAAQLRNTVTLGSAPYSQWSPKAKRAIEKLSDDGNLLYFSTLPNEWDQE